jgi:hypothetical protein
MRKFIALSALTATLLLSIQAPADAGPRHRAHRGHDSYAAQYPGATPRQLQNLRAYDRGEFYETYSEALPTGSRPWFEAKEREGSFRRF